MAVFNAVGDQPDHAAAGDAGRSALLRVSTRLADEHPAGPVSASGSRPARPRSATSAPPSSGASQRSATRPTSPHASSRSLGPARRSSRALRRASPETSGSSRWGRSRSGAGASRSRSSRSSPRPEAAARESAEIRTTSRAFTDVRTARDRRYSVGTCRTDPPRRGPHRGPLRPGRDDPARLGRRRHHRRLAPFAARDRLRRRRRASPGRARRTSSSRAASSSSSRSWASRSCSSSSG